VLWVSDPSWFAKYYPPFKEGLRELGWIDGTIQIIERFDTGEDANRLPGLVKELLALRIDVLYITDGAAAAARQATARVPSVCSDFFDPVLEGLTSSVSRPDRNFTGMSLQSSESGFKRVQLTRELMPGLRRIALLFDGTDPAGIAEAREMRNAARAAGLDFRGIEVKGARDFPAAFAELKRNRPDALIASAGAAIFGARDKIISVASAARVPVINEIQEYAEAGAVLTYGPAIPDAYRRGAYFVDRILRGAKVTDLPIEQPTKFHIVVNLRMARALGLTVPESLMVSAARLIRQ
jgi:putative ABC transport system substrate-binding protein